MSPPPPFQYSSCNMIRDLKMALLCRALFLLIILESGSLIFYEKRIRAALDYVLKDLSVYT